MTSILERGDYEKGFKQMCYWMLGQGITNEQLLTRMLSAQLPYLNGPEHYKRGAQNAMHQLISLRNYIEKLEAKNA